MEKKKIEKASKKALRAKAGFKWGQGVVKDLSDYLLKSIADPRGFSARNLWRMKQFFDLYGSYEILSTVLTVFHPEISNIIRDSYSLAFLGHEFFNLSVREMQAEYRSKE